MPGELPLPATAVTAVLWPDSLPAASSAVTVKV